MAGRIIGGLSGWLISLAPLILVNALTLVTALSPDLIPIAGGASLIAGIALGGLAAGLIGGRRGDGWGGVVAGGIAAALFAASLIGLMYLLRAQHVLPYLLEQHPVRAMGAIGFVACLVVALAAGVGAFSARRSNQMAAERAAALRTRSASGRQPSGPTPQQYPRSGPYSGPPRSPMPPPHYRGPRESDPYAPPRQPRERSSREQSSRW